MTPDGLASKDGAVSAPALVDSLQGGSGFAAILQNNHRFSVCTEDDPCRGSANHIGIEVMCAGTGRAPDTACGLPPGLKVIQ